MNQKTITNKLEPMIGKQFLIGTNPERIVSYKFDQSHVKLITDKRTRSFDEDQLFDFIKTQCLDMEEDFEEMTMQVSNHGKNLPASAAPTQQVYVPSFNNSHFKDLRNVLMKNIEKVQEDKNYLPQAVAVRDNVQSVIDLTKNEIEFMKTVNRIRK